MVLILQQEDNPIFLLHMKSYDEWAPMWGADTRKPQSAKASRLRSLGAPATSYGLNKGDKLTFDPKYKNVDMMDDDIQTQPPINAGRRDTVLVPVIVNGVPTWLNPMFFLRQQRVNNRNTPVYPAWAALGDAYAVVDHLIKQGGIEIPVEGEVKAQMPAFDQTTGEAAYVTQMVNNQPVRVRSTEERIFPVVPDPKQL